MIPEDITMNTQSQELKPSTTFRIDFKKNKIIGTTDGLEAVKQAVFLVLITDRDYSGIYRDYGIKTVDLIGQDFSFAASEIKKRIRETLMEDDRITEVENFTFTDDISQKEGILVEFDVVSIYGTLHESEVYNI